MDHYHKNEEILRNISRNKRRSSFIFYSSQNSVEFFDLLDISLLFSPQIIDDNNLLMETFDQTNINQNNYQAENFVPIESVIEISSQPYEYIEEYKEAL